MTYSLIAKKAIKTEMESICAFHSGPILAHRYACLSLFSYFLQYYPFPLATFSSLPRA
jgi:hypothetical protein